MEAYTGFAPVYDMYMDNIPYDDWADNIIKIFIFIIIIKIIIN